MADLLLLPPLLTELVLLFLECLPDYSEPPLPFLLSPFLDDPTFNVFYFLIADGLRKSPLSSLSVANRFLVEPPVDKVVGEFCCIGSIGFCFGDPPTDYD